MKLILLFGLNELGKLLSEGNIWLTSPSATPIQLATTAEHCDDEFVGINRPRPSIPRP